MAPLARIFLTLMGNSPRVVLSRFDTLLQSSSRGIKARWVDDEPQRKGGVLTLQYELPRSPAVGHAWTGALRHVLAFCNAEGQVEILEPTADRTGVRLHVGWK